jgi:hypothetical protein
VIGQPAYQFIQAREAAAIGSTGSMCQMDMPDSIFPSRNWHIKGKEI